MRDRLIANPPSCVIKPGGRNVEPFPTFTCNRHSHLRDGAVMSDLNDLISDSGYELVAKRKQRSKAKPATARDYLELDWEPWKRSPCVEPGGLLPRRSDWDQGGITARMAYAAMLLTRAELIESIQNLDDETIEEILFRLANTKERLLGIAAMTDAALTRVMAAAHHKLAPLTPASPSA
jgi:hypothetical protein